MRNWRWPIVVMLVVGLGAALAYEARRSPPVEDLAAAPLTSLMPSVPGPDASGSTWFCAGGTARGTGDAELTVSVLNGGDGAALVRFTAMTDTGERISQDRTVEAATRLDLAATELLDADWTGILVEADQPEVAVEQRVVDGDRVALGACASRASAEWYVPFGTTRAGSRAMLLVFNPFPDDAVLDIRFETDDGTRTPEEYRPRLVRGGHVAALDVTGVVTLRQQLSAVVTARSGRMVVASLGWWDGTDDSPVGLTFTPGAPRLAETWLFAAGGPVDEAGLEQLIAFNPAELEATGEVLVGAAPEAMIEPFSMVVRPTSTTAVDLAADGRVPDDIAFWSSAAVYEGPSIAAAFLRAGPDGDGVAVTVGSPLVAGRWLVPAGAVPGTTESALVIANPGSRPLDVEVEVLRNGDRSVLDGAPLELGAYEQVRLDLSGLAGPSSFGLEVRADGGVVVERTLVVGSSPTVSLAVPVADTLALPPPPPPIDLEGITTGTGLPDIEVPVPGTAPGTTAGTAPAVPFDDDPGAEGSPAGDGSDTPVGDAPAPEPDAPPPP